MQKKDWVRLAVLMVALVVVGLAVTFAVGNGPGCSAARDGRTVGKCASVPGGP